MSSMMPVVKLPRPEEKTVDKSEASSGSVAVISSGPLKAFPLEV